MAQKMLLPGRYWHQSVGVQEILAVDAWLKQWRPIVKVRQSQFQQESLLARTPAQQLTIFEVSAPVLWIGPGFPTLIKPGQPDPFIESPSVPNLLDSATAAAEAVAKGVQTATDFGPLLLAGVLLYLLTKE